MDNQWLRYEFYQKFIQCTNFYGQRCSRNPITFYTWTMQNLFIEFNLNTYPELKPVTALMFRCSDTVPLLLLLLTSTGLSVSNNAESFVLLLLLTVKSLPNVVFESSKSEWCSDSLSEEDDEGCRANLREERTSTSPNMETPPTGFYKCYKIRWDYFNVSQF